MPQDNDDFWNIALSEESVKDAFFQSQDEDVDDKEEDHDSEEISAVAKFTKYHLPTTDVTLRLQSLPSTDGVWSPLGADAWYASALLASLLLTTTNIEDDNNDHDDCVVLELGSGAVGLSGLACAVALATQTKQSMTKAKVILTDNDATVLKALQRNVETNREAILALRDKEVQVEVQHLDWKDGFHSLGSSLDLVIGSELVYTKDTAVALCHLLEELLMDNNHRHLKICVVQVTDRFGWLDIVMPRLESIDGVTIRSESISSDIHDLACTMIPMGGTLDRHAYGAVWIQRGS